MFTLKHYGRYLLIDANGRTVGEGATLPEVLAAAFDGDGGAFIIDQPRIELVITKEVPGPAPVYNAKELVAVAGITPGSASIGFPTAWGVNKVGRDGVDAKGNGPWEGSIEQLPFGNLVAGQTYQIYVITADGTRVATNYTVPTPAPQAPTPPPPAPQTPPPPAPVPTPPAPKPPTTGFATPKLWGVATSRTGSDRGFGTAAGRNLLKNFKGVTIGAYNSSHTEQMRGLKTAVPELTVLVYQCPWEVRAYPTLSIGASAGVAVVEMPKGGNYPSLSAAGVEPGKKIRIRGSSVAAFNIDVTVLTVDSANARWTFKTSAVGSDTTGGALFLRVDDARRALFDQVSDHNWWTRRKGTTGPGVGMSRYPGVFDVNLTKWAPPDAEGLRYAEWLAKFGHETWGDACDGYWQDNVLDPIRTDFYAGVRSADWKRAGATQLNSLAEVVAAHREGLASYAHHHRKLRAQALVFGNADNDLSAAPFKGVYDGVFYEHAMDKSFAVRWKRCQDVIKNLRGPRTIVFHDDRPNLTPKMVRAGLACGLVICDNMHFATDYDVHTLHDEYFAPIGEPIEPAQSSAREAGLWIRRFENGVAIYNPGSSTARFLEAGYRKVGGADRKSGSMLDASFNNGSNVTTLSLAGGEGAVLIKA